MALNDYQQYLLDKWVVNQESIKLCSKTTVTCLRLHNGHEIIGTSTCMEPIDYDLNEGIEVATINALLKLKEIDEYTSQSNNAWF